MRHDAPREVSRLWRSTSNLKGLQNAAGFCNHGIHDDEILSADSQQ